MSEDVSKLAEKDAVQVRALVSRAVQVILDGMDVFYAREEGRSDESLRNDIEEFKLEGWMFVKSALERDIRVGEFFGDDDGNEARRESIRRIKSNIKKISRGNGDGQG